MTKRKQVKAVKAWALHLSDVGICHLVDFRRDLVIERAANNRHGWDSMREAGYSVIPVLITPITKRRRK